MLVASTFGIIFHGGIFVLRVAWAVLKDYILHFRKSTNNRVIEYFLIPDVTGIGESC